ncbi:5'/3'-nucleotidase SurE [Alicyclobacillus sp.]|uniref:5'/3'-nucleotidase SurE n=1 Tax=Alicyclobacillus sp. TaxID=61169 RepID=UPI0025BA7626|nr:5'/3'-nucleotidase SurE [Alicyclobacillus sp.]MCL6515518.1 5'/3'-nucleotidase SurE [Alicyclobacillus sp.]
MRILISNDDGVRAPGIRAIAAAMARIGEVCVVAPDRQRSASSHGISFHRPLYVEPVALGVGEAEAYAVSGTPVDCVKWAVTVLGRRRPFDWMVSGINEGANLAADVLYSGTVAAAGEAALQHIPAVALSLCGPPWPFEEAAEAALHLIRWLQSRGPWPADTFLNVNLPARSLPNAPWKATVLGVRGYRDAFREEADEAGRVCFRYAGEAVEELGGPGTDVIAVRSGCISVTPLRYRFTNESWLGTLESWMDGTAHRGG